MAKRGILTVHLLILAGFGCSASEFIQIPTDETVADENQIVEVHTPTPVPSPTVIPTPTVTPTPFVDLKAPTLSSVSPGVGELGVDPRAAISAIFSESIDSSTLNATSVSVASDGVLVPGSLSVSTDKIIFTPSERFSLASKITVTLANTIKDLAGNALSPFSWEFSVRDGLWSGAQELASGDLGEHKIGLDRFGSEVAIWTQSDGSRHNLFGNRAPVAASWSAFPTALEFNSAGSAYDSQLKVFGNGEALAVWVQSNGVTEHIYSNTAPAGAQFSTVPKIISSGMPASQPRLAGSSDGKAFAVWMETDPTTFDTSVWSCRYVSGLGWGSAEKISGAALGAHSPEIAVDSAGNASAVWMEKNNTGIIILSLGSPMTRNIIINRFIDGTGWLGPEGVGANRLYSAGSPQIALHDSGAMLIVWQQYNLDMDIVAISRVPGAQWSAPTSIDVIVSSGGIVSGSDASNPTISFGANGMGLVSWIQADATWSTQLYVRTFDSASGWSARQQVSSHASGGSASEGRVVIDPQGNAMAVWNQEDVYATYLCASRLLKGAVAWSPCSVIDIGTQGSSFSIEVGVTSNGVVAASWFNQVSSLGLIANRFE